MKKYFFLWSNIMVMEIYSILRDITQYVRHFNIYFTYHLKHINALYYIPLETKIRLHLSVYKIDNTFKYITVSVNCVTK